MALSCKNRAPVELNRRAIVFLESVSLDRCDALSVDSSGTISRHFLPSRVATSKDILLERRNLVLYDLSYTLNQVLYLDWLFQCIDSPDLEIFDIAYEGAHYEYMPGIAALLQ